MARAQLAAPHALLPLTLAQALAFSADNVRNSVHQYLCCQETKAVLDSVLDLQAQQLQLAIEIWNGSAATAAWR